MADIKPINSCLCGVVKMTLRAIDPSNTRNCKAYLMKIYAAGRGRRSTQAVGQEMEEKREENKEENQIKQRKGESEVRQEQQSDKKKRRLRRKKE